MTRFPRHVRRALGLAAAAVLLLGACGQEDPDPAVPTVDQLAAALMTPDDVAGTWTVNLPPGAEDASDGVVPDDQQELLPRIDLCDKAGEQALSAAETLRWQAFRQIDQTEQDPIDMAGGDRVGHMIFVQEFLVADDPAEIEATFDALRDGLQACLGRIPAGEEGPGRAEPMTVPEVGDDRYGTLTTVEEAGGGAYWLLHNTLVRQGPVLMDLQVVDIVMGAGVEPVFTTDDIDTFVTTAVEKLPG